MKTSLRSKLDSLADRHREVTALLADPEVIGAQGRFRDLSREYAQLEPLVRTYADYRRNEAALEGAEEMLRDDDAELRGLAAEELDRAVARRAELEQALQLLLLPRDPDDARDAYLEIRAGTGGAEAALFAADLQRMYLRYAEAQGWRVEEISASEAEQGGYKELILRVSGDGAYGRLKFESGAHRVQRVPETESQGRIHTSACTVAVLAEAEEVDAIEVNPADLRIDTYRASGAGGQHVNKTDSAVRVTHLPSGIVVECQDERSQHKNRARALALLSARLLAREREAQAAATAATRKLLVGSGDRSERIRTYNFPQGRLTDHRINLTLYKLHEILEGDLDQVIAPLQQEHQAELLAAQAGA